MPPSSKPSFQRRTSDIYAHRLLILPPNILLSLIFASQIQSCIRYECVWLINCYSCYTSGCHHPSSAISYCSSTSMPPAPPLFIHGPSNVHSRLTGPTQRSTSHQLTILELTFFEFCFRHLRISVIIY